MSTSAPTGPLGFTCVICGQRVPHGTTHSCTKPVWVNPPAPPTPTVHMRIAAALERIAAALERSGGAEGDTDAA